MFASLRVWSRKWNQVLCLTRYTVPVCQTRFYGTHYDTLKINKNASVKEIRKAYLELSKELHPDLNKTDPSSKKYFIQLNEAYKVLSNPQSKLSYDAQLGYQQTNYKTSQQSSGFDGNQSTTSHKQGFTQTSQRDETNSKQGGNQQPVSLKSRIKFIMSYVYLGIVILVACKIFSAFLWVMQKISTGIERDVNENFKTRNWAGGNDRNTQVKND